MAIGFIVEGDSEFDSYPSFVGRILGSFHPNKIQNVSGIGNLTHNLEKELFLMVSTHAIDSIIITIDSNDCIREGTAKDCLEVKQIIQEQVDSFFMNHQHMKDRLPKEIVVVIVDKQHETWLCSDIDGLKGCDLINKSTLNESFTNVDQEIDNPLEWLQSKLKDNINLKSRRYRKKLASAINPEVSMQFSRSFRKFHKEVIRLGGQTD